MVVGSIAGNNIFAQVKPFTKQLFNLSNFITKPNNMGNNKKAIVRYVPITGFVAQIIGEKDMCVLPVKTTILLNNGQEVEGKEVNGFFIIKNK